MAIVRQTVWRMGNMIHTPHIRTVCSKIFRTCWNCLCCCCCFYGLCVKTCACDDNFRLLSLGNSMNHGLRSKTETRKDEQTQ